MLLYEVYKGRDLGVHGGGPLGAAGADAPGDDADLKNIKILNLHNKQYTLNEV